MDECDALKLKLLPQDLVRTVTPGWTGGELGLGGCWGSTWLSHLIRWIFHLLHVPPNHILGILACGWRDRGTMSLRRSEGGALRSRWGSCRREGAKGELRASRVRCMLGQEHCGCVWGWGVTRDLLFLRCFFLVLRHTPGTPGTGFTSLLLTGGGCRMGLGARVRHTGSPAAHSRIPVIPGWRWGGI